MIKPPKYFAFISYSSKDTDWGRRLQNKLEHFKLPATLCNEYGWERRPIKPVFFAPTDIQPGGLTEELQERLKASKHFIVICSPNSAKSEWVGKEIEFFHGLGRTKNIHFFIVDGIPNSGNLETECFNPIIKELGLPEILGANIHEKIYHQPWLNRERAYVQLISKLLGVEFDSIWQRHRRQLVQKSIALTTGSIAILCTILLVWRANQPFNVEVRLKELSSHNDKLPPLRNAIITIGLENETKCDTLRSMDSCIVFHNIPRRFFKQKVEFHVSCCPAFNDTTTTVALISKLEIGILRNEHYYGDVRFRFWNQDKETSSPNEKVSIAGIETMSDEDGFVTLFIPMEKQDSCYRITTTIPLIEDFIEMPCSGSEIIKTR